jgi:hypothetical protein
MHARSEPQCPLTTACCPFVAPRHPFRRQASVVLHITHSYLHVGSMRAPAIMLPRHHLPSFYSITGSLGNEFATKHEKNGTWCTATGWISCN